MDKMTFEELQYRQGWTLEQKIDHSLGTIEYFVNEMGGLDKVYLSFSGGKDSTVLLDLCRKLYPNILTVFCSTGNEYPDIIKFVNQKKEEGVNLQIIHPSLTPKQVWEKYGFPLVSKETASKIHKVRYNPTTDTSKMIMGDGKYRLPYKWRWLVYEPFETTAQCCDKLKKEPFHKFNKATGRVPILGTMASESNLRKMRYIKDGGCNVFGKSPKSQPLSIWTEQDIWDYIQRYNLPIADIYYKGAKRTGCMGCGFGAQYKDDDRFDILQREYPKCYKMVMGYTNNGITFKEAMDKVKEYNSKGK